MSDISLVDIEKAHLNFSDPNKNAATIADIRRLRIKAYHYLRKIVKLRQLYLLDAQIILNVYQAIDTGLTSVSDFIIDKNSPSDQYCYPYEQSHINKINSATIASVIFACLALLISVCVFLTMRFPVQWMEPESYKNSFTNKMFACFGFTIVLLLLQVAQLSVDSYIVYANCNTVLNYLSIDITCIFVSSLVAYSLTHYLYSNKKKNRLNIREERHYHEFLDYIFVDSKTINQSTDPFVDNRQFLEQAEKSIITYF